jgi:hypothetical protein
LKVPRRPVMDGARHDEKVGDADDRSGSLRDSLGAGFSSSDPACLEGQADPPRMALSRTIPDRAIVAEGDKRR